MLILKEGVDIRGLQPEMSLGILILYTKLLPISTNGKVVITAITDGKHKTNSLHYVGSAVDIRIWNLDNIKGIIQDLKESMAGFDFFLHSDHLHVEYQPKTGLNL